ncbi:amino acid permease [Microbacterium sp. RD10]|uniref:amino acid permease n=1 Tax=unclassified Microbacterium TaxID=2609290 RepID=UPI0032AFE52E
MFVLVSWSGALAWSPNWQALSADEVEAVGVSLVRVLGGAPFAAFFIAIYVVSCFGSAMTGQASVSRLLIAVGRDGVLPRPLTKLHPGSAHRLS